MRIVSALLFITLFVLGITLLERQTVDKRGPASFLPADTVMYLEQQDGAKAIANFKKSRIGGALASIDLRQVLTDAEVNRGTMMMVEGAAAYINQLQSNKLISEVLGKKCVVALFPERSWSNTAQSLEEFFELHLVLISKPRIRIDFLEGLISQYSDQIQIEDVPYGNYLIKRFYLERGVLSVVFVEGYMIASFEERTVREALQFIDNKESSLAADKDFKEFSAELKGAERIVYFAIDGLQSLAEYGARRSTDLKEKAILEEMSSLKGLTSIAYGSWRGGATINNTFHVTFDKEAMDPLVREMISTKSSINATLPFVAKDVLFYYWSNTLNIRLLWEMYVAEAGSNDTEVNNIKQIVNDFSGYEIETLIGMLSSSVGVLLKQSERKQFVPIPDLALMIKLNDTEKVGKVLKRSLGELDINIQSRKYKEIEYFYWGLYDQESLQPVYAIHREYLIFANTLDMLRTIIDTPVNGSRLISSSGFVKIDPGFQKFNNSVCYIDQASLLNHLTDLFSWSSTLLAIQDRDAAERSKKLVKNLIEPLFYGMAMYKKVATRTVIDNDRIIIETKTEISH